MILTRVTNSSKQGSKHASTKDINYHKLALVWSENDGQLVNTWADHFDDNKSL